MTIEVDMEKKIVVKVFLDGEDATEFLKVVKYLSSETKAEFLCKKAGRINMNKENMLTIDNAQRNIFRKIYSGVLANE